MPPDQRWSLAMLYLVWLIAVASERVDAVRIAQLPP
jgi:hypothetical protein